MTRPAVEEDEDEGDVIGVPIEQEQLFEVDVRRMIVSPALPAPLLSPFLRYL